MKKVGSQLFKNLLKSNMKKLLTFFLLFSLLGFNAKAYDFTAICATGQTLAYSITSDTMPYTVSLVRGDADREFDYSRFRNEYWFIRFFEL